MIRKHIRRSSMLLALLAIFGACLERAYGVILDDTNQINIVLSGGITLRLIGEATDTPGVKSNRYYYLPANLRLSARPDSTPEFLFLKFTTESRGGISGALMHFLMEWGLTREQESELREKLRQDYHNAELGGQAPMQADGEGGTFQIVSATLTDKQLTPSVVTSGKAPLVAGGKAAAATRLSAEGAQLMAATFEKSRSITDLSIGLNYSYVTLAPAAKGFIEFDWSKLETEFESISAEYTHSHKETKKCFIVCWDKHTSDTYSYNEMRDQFKFLEEKKVVRLQFDEYIADERVAKIREAFFQFFVGSMARPMDQDKEAALPKDKEKDKDLDIRHGNRYTFNQSSFQQAYSRKTDHFSLMYRTSLRYPYQIVANLASWYDGVRDNPKCVASINLNDPFFTHRDINFILDLDAKEIFEEAINYVTINVRKKRSEGRPFEDRVTMDAKYLKDKGVKATMTYARGEDKDPDNYEYQMQWSLRGGQVYPKNPSWERGVWEGVTLSAPILARNITVAGDIDALKASDLTRVTVQVHYSKFGQEVEENIHLSTLENKPEVSRRIFMDRNAKGYVTRLILNHKTQGKLALPWSAHPVGDDYVYANIPQDLLKTPDLLQVAKDTGKTALQSATEKVLDRFSELIGERK